MRSMFTTLTASRQSWPSLDLFLPGMPVCAGNRLCKGGAGREGGRRVSDGLATGERRVMLAMYLRVNHWVDFDESYSDGHLE